MSSLDSVPSHIVSQRRKFEILGMTLNKGENLKSWFNVLKITALIVGIPTIPLLSDVLKDQIIYYYQAIIFGFRLLLLFFLFHWTSKITTYIAGANNDVRYMLNAIGTKDKTAFSKEEIALARNYFIFKFIQLLVTLNAIMGIFLLNARINYGYIIGQTVIYAIVVILLLVTIKFWSTNKPKESPRMGGKILVQMFIPAMFMFAIELILDFFLVASKPNFNFNVLQLTWGTVYLFIFLFIFIAVQITTKKTKREKLVLEEAWLAEYKKKQRFIHERNIITKTVFILQSNWHNFMRKIFKIPEKTEEDLDKKPSEILVKSMWITLFITVIPVGFFIPWIMFPYDGIMLLIVLITAYIYSMTKYERYKLDVISEEQEAGDKEDIRGIQFQERAFYSFVIPTLIFIFAQLIFNGVLTKGVFDVYKMMVIDGLTWLALLIAIPVSIQMVYLLVTNTEQNREKENLKLFVKTEVLFFIMGLIVLLGTVIAYFYAKRFDVVLVIPKAILMYIIIVIVINILPTVFGLIVPKLSDESYNIVKWTYIALVAIADIAIIIWFLFDMLISHFVL